MGIDYIREKIGEDPKKKKKEERNVSGVNFKKHFILVVVTINSKTEDRSAPHTHSLHQEVTQDYLFHLLVEETHMDPKNHDQHNTKTLFMPLIYSPFHSTSPELFVVYS